MTRTHCAVKNCRNSNKNKDIHFFRFPKEPERLHLWLKLCGLYDLLVKETNYCYSNYKICSAHFETHMFSNVQKNKLLPLAVPMLHSLPPNLENINTSDAANKINENGNVTKENIKSCTKKLRSSKKIEKRKQTSISFLSITDADGEKKLREIILENNGINLIKDEVECGDSSHSITKEEIIKQENIIVKSEDSNDSHSRNSFSEMPKLSSTNMSSDSSLITSNVATTTPQWIILISSEANKISSSDTNPSTIMSMDATSNLTLPGILSSNPTLPTIPTIDPTIMQPLAVSQPVTATPQQNFMNPLLSMDSNLNNQWIILLNSTGPKSSVTNTLTNTSATLISGQTNNILQTPPSALPTVPTTSSLPQTLPQLPVVPNILNNTTGVSNPLQTPADWIVVVTSTAPETKSTQSLSLQIESIKSEPDVDSKILNVAEPQSSSCLISSQNITSNIKASISFETKSVTSNSMSVSSIENTSCVNKNNKESTNGHTQKKNESAKKCFVESAVKNIEITKFLKMCKKFLSPEMLQLVKIHIVYKNKHLKCLKNINKFKQFALKMHSISPQAYKYCADILKLPSKKCLKNIT